jgi:hypothetical protein
MLSFDDVVKKKKDKLPEFTAIMMFLFGGNDFDIIPDNSYTIMNIIPHENPQRKMEPFSVYWSLNMRKDYIDLKSGKYNSNYSKYKWNIIVNFEVKYLIEGSDVSNFHLIRVDGSLSDRIVSIVKSPQYSHAYYNDMDNSFYNRILLKDISEWIMYSTSNTKPIFTGKLSNLYEKMSVVSIFRDIFYKYEQGGKWAVKNREILGPAEMVVRDKFFIPLNKEGHYYSMKTKDSMDRTILQNDLWNFLKACYMKWGYVISVRNNTKENLYFWNKKSSLPEIPHGNINEFEE